jgi:peptidoglycan/xylan/chitin deacetylase (PgdA/CDA1 family)
LRSTSRYARTLCAVAILTAVVAVALSGCGRKAAEAEANHSKSLPHSISSSASAPSSSTISTALPRIAATDTLEPVSYVGFEPLPCFTYHHVDPKITNDITIKPATFEAELKMLKSLGYHSITARQLVDHQTLGTPLPDKPVMLTFDDGWRNQYTHAWPLMKKYGFTGTFFINPQPISAHYKGYMTRDMISALAKAGNDIESHTWRHLRLTRTNTEQTASFQKRSRSQLTQANDWIRKVVGQQPVALCYPYGYYDLETIGLAQAVGYKVAFTVDEGVADARPWDAFAMKRFTISSAETTDSFRRRLLSGPLPVTNIQPPPGSRVIGVDTTVTVDITDVPSTISGIRLRSGPSMKAMHVVERNGRKYAEAVIHKSKRGFRPISMTGTGQDGRRYYSCWGLEMGDKAQ